MPNKLLPILLSYLCVCVCVCLIYIERQTVPNIERQTVPNINHMYFSLYSLNHLEPISLTLGNPVLENIRGAGIGLSG